MFHLNLIICKKNLYFQIRFHSEELQIKAPIHSLEGDIIQPIAGLTTLLWIDTITQHCQTIPLEFLTLLKLKLVKRKGTLCPYPEAIYKALNPIGEADSHTIKFLKMSREGVSATSASPFALSGCLCPFPPGV